MTQDSMYVPIEDMDEVTAHAWQFYLAIADLALAQLQTLPAGSIAISDTEEDAYWSWQGTDQSYLAWAPIADGRVCLEAAILLLESVGLSAEEIHYRREALTRWLQSETPAILPWQRTQLQQAIRKAGEY
ncbi:hypothetical protein [Chitinibacter sp. S2-10]|uniref:hypothetical protein n=1 Tax=Chitinibacter sp. S2-10 TaxID=3373597 RepID=UPI0039778B8B